MFEIIPGILEKQWSEIEKKIELVKPFAKSIHVDIIDGKFSPETTFLDPTPFAKYAKDLFLEVHFMTDNPVQYLEPFAKAGFKRFIGHVEKMPDQAEFVVKAEELGEVGLAVDGATPLDKIKVPYVDLDCLVLMTIQAGKSGQTFNSEYLKKIEALRLGEKDIEIPIEIDGGINSETISLAKNKGANRFVANSFIFNGNPQEQFDLLNKCLG
jgi:ribulose-phosphate 3-epimerase